jgi:hypothetical protein
MPKDTTDLETWNEIAEQMKAVQDEYNELFRLLPNVPKSVWMDEYADGDDSITQLKSDLEDRMSEEHPDEWDTDVFYGE